ncbi:MAG: 4-hydroxybutyrate--acetyl-CoA CoA transferase [Candidatus Kapabacteria bacterium]|nr:4-hydroxybutyrate--acetyl-CoA CoA transferase [Candidatus Kapabacteria bacterium]
MSHLLYQQKLTTADRAVEIIRDSDTVLHGMLVAEPPALLNAMADRIQHNLLKNISIYTLIPYGHSKNSYLKPEILEKINANSWFCSSEDRGLVKQGLTHFVPNNFNQIPRFIKDNMSVDIVMTTVSPMDKNGYFTFGTSNDYITTAARNTKKLIVEVNEYMPRVFGDSLIHISEVDLIVENTCELQTFMPSPPKPESDIIGQIIIDHIPDGATIQLGVGGIPSAVCQALLERRDLGIHSEVFCPEMIKLVTSGAANGRKKKIHRFKHTYTIAQGNRELYDFLNDNVSIESYPVSILNHPTIIAQQPNMISINATIEIDLHGQCNSEFMNGSQFSATGGQLDFVRGAYFSEGGKSIIAFYSTAKANTISKIVPRLSDGAIVTVPRSDVHYLATEYGIVNLKGKNTRQRALDIISLAHPNFRDDLIKEAEKMKII